MAKKTLLQFQKMKKTGEKLTWITAYDYPFSYCAEQAGIDMILVGDSGGMTTLGYQTTNPVTMDEMIHLAKAVRRGAPNTFIVGDMPQGTYEVSDADAISNALRFVKEAGCDAIKLEGGERMASRVRAISNAGILAIGHLGLTPQSTGSFGGYRVQGKTMESFEETMSDAMSLQKNGAFCILLEAMPSEPSGQVARQCEIPIYGIGAGDQVDGQLIILHDLMGFYKDFRPFFTKCYVPDCVGTYQEEISKIKDLKQYGRDTRKDGLLFLTELCIRKYIDDVHHGIFPGKEFSYPIKEEELQSLKKSKHWK
jgi:3-methyl-2-oxobutanoate hydroxymethyltransferase